MKHTFGLFVPLLALLFLAGCAEREPVAPQTGQEMLPLMNGPTDDGGRGQLKVMTWNIYVGTDVDMVLGADSLEEVPFLVAQAYEMLKMTNFPERAAAIAANIKKERPALIGLQEVSLIQLFDPTASSLVEQTDFLQILMDAIHARGLNYMLADSVQNADVTVPRFAGFDNDGNPIIDYVRLLDADVILVRSDIVTSDVMKGQYSVALPIPDLGISIPRGYVSVLAEAEGKMYRFVSTHLEAFLQDIRMAQAMELTATFAGETKPVIMVGDFNTDTPGSESPFNDATYQYLTGDGGYVDTWVWNLYGNRGTGYTFGHDPDLMNAYPDMTTRIDLILVRNYGAPAGRNMIGPVQAEVLGDELRDKTASGLWPSDHGGVIAKLHLMSPVTM